MSIMKKPKECVCIETLIFWEEDNKYAQNSTWKEIEFKANELYPYIKRRVKRAGYTMYRLHKRDEEGLILQESYTLSEDSFKKHFMDIGLFREVRINEILDEK